LLHTHMVLDREGLAHERSDRLPPGMADRGEVAFYLVTLIRWLNTDPWPQDTRFDGPALTPEAIERKLSIVVRRGQELDADDVAARCARLVVLGGPGSGKTWLARRTVRLRAAAALEALAAGALLDEVELPLYTTCAALFAAPSHYGIRRAIVASPERHERDGRDWTVALLVPGVGASRARAVWLIAG